MKKRLLLIALVIILSTGNVVQTEIHAEAAGTVTAVGVAKAVMVLLAIAGVGITLGSIFDEGDIDESAVVKFTTWLNNHDPEFYTEFMVAASAITAGRMVNTFAPLFYQKLRQNAREYFGTNTNVSTSVGSYVFNINNLAISGLNTGYTATFGSSSPDVYHFNGLVPYSVIPFTFYNQYGDYCLFFVPTTYDPNIVGAPGSGSIAPVMDIGFYGYTVTGLNYATNTNRTSYYWVRLLSANFGVYKTGLGGNPYDTMQRIINNYYSGQYANAEKDLVMAPYTTVGNVAATSTDATVVGAGQTITEDGDGEIVIDGDRTINLSNVNIDEWLKALAEGTQTYAQAMQAIGLAAVNTQTQTLEEVQAIVQALNPAAAGTGTITGNYTVALSDLFPFCIPFDLYNIISCFKADPVAPSAEITIPVGYDGTEFTWETYTVDLSMFDPVASVVRVLEYVAFIIGLMLVTRKLIEG